LSLDGAFSFRAGAGCNLRWHFFLAIGDEVLDLLDRDEHVPESTTRFQ